MTSAPKRSPQIADGGQADAVDRDRVALGELAGQRRLDGQAHAVGGASTRATCPRSATSPVNTALTTPAAARRRARRRRSRSHVEGQRAQGVGDALDALALERVAGACGRRAAAARGTGAPRRSRRRRGTRRPGAGRPRAASLVTGGSSAPSWSSAERTRAGSFSPVATMTSAPARLERVGGAARRGARDDDDQRHLGRVGDELARSSGRRAVESKTTRRGWRWTPSMRAVSCGSSASAVPMPTATASTEARQRCAERAARLARDPLGVAGARGDLAVEAHRRLEERPSGRPVRACLRKAWLCRRARAASSPPATSTSTPSSRRMPSPRPDAFSARVVAGHDDAADARARGSRRCTAAGWPVVAAGLERDVERRAAQVGVAAGGDRVDLGVRAAVLLVPALAEHVAVARRRPRRRPGWG